jgi:transcriptional regulator with XRE-family HTH domain
MANKKKETSPEFISAKVRLINEIRKIREESGLSQSYVARMMGLSQATFSDIENEENVSQTFPLEDIVKIAQILNVNPHRLLAVFTNENPNSYNSKEKELINKFSQLLDNYRSEGNPPNVPVAKGPQPTHPSQIGTRPFETMERVDAEIDELNSNKPAGKPIENQDF